MHKKKRILDQLWIVCACVLTLGCCAFAIFAQGKPTGDEDAVLNLKIRTEDAQRVYTERERIRIRVELTNVSSRDVFLGKDMWSWISPSRVTMSVAPADGHAMTGEEGAADGLAPNHNLAWAILNWCFLLSSGYSYASTTVLRSDLTPGTYKVRALFESRGIDSDSFYNPLLNHPEELEKLRSQNWKGIVASNELTIKIVSRDGKPSGRSLK
jgi:hypothetical protein